MDNKIWVDVENVDMISVAVDAKDSVFDFKGKIAEMLTVCSQVADLSSDRGKQKVSGDTSGHNETERAQTNESRDRIDWQRRFC